MKEGELGAEKVSVFWVQMEARLTGRRVFEMTVGWIGMAVILDAVSW
jgi:hypothetical protein